MTKTKTKTRGANLPVPQNRDAAARAVLRIGTLTRELTRREADMNDNLARIKAAVETTAEPLRDEVSRLTEGLKTWCEANRALLTDDGKVKYANLGTGLVKWRLRPPRVSLPRDIAALVDRLKAMGLRRFVRVQEEPDKEAMRAEAEVARTVPGVRIGSEGEDFVVEPFEAELAQVAS